MYLVMEQTSSRLDLVRASCLTCRRRHKKCDKAWPACEVCALDGYACLGYGRLPRDATQLSLHGVPKASENASKTPISYVTEPSYVLFSADSGGTLSTASEEHTFAPISRRQSLVLESSSPPYLDSHFTSARLNHATLPNLVSRLTNIDPRSSSTGQAQISNPADSTKTSIPILPRRSTVGRHTSSNSVVNVRQSRRTPVSLSAPYPQNLTHIPNDMGRIVGFILSKYEQFIDTAYARPSYDDFLRYREWGKQQLQLFDAIRVPILIRCKLLELSTEGTSKQKLAYYTRCMEKFEQYLSTSSDESMSAFESFGRNSGLLEIAFVKLMHTSPINTYRLLRKTAPAFVQVAYLDYLLGGTHFDCVSIPLGHVISSTQSQLPRFVLLDSVYSMAYALPQVVEYNTTNPLLLSEIRSVEWIHGCPPEFQFALVEINQWCNSVQRIGPKTDWRSIEHRIKSWQPKARAVPDRESWKSVARLAVQESWRHALLIYLYMAADGVMSDDARVHACVQQVFKLTDIVKQFEVRSRRAPLLVQHLIAGICTPYETQRTKAEERLCSTLDASGMWLLRGCEFVPVLTHLWRGAASGGRPIRWSDYVYSRYTILPIHL